MGRGLLWAGAQPQGGPGRSHRKATWSKDLIQRKNPQAADGPGPDSRRMTEAVGEVRAFYWAGGAAASRLSVQVVGLNVGGDLSLPLVPVVEQLFLIVQKLLMCLRGKLKVGALQVGSRSR